MITEDHLYTELGDDPKQSAQSLQKTVEAWHDPSHFTKVFVGHERLHKLHKAKSQATRKPAHANIGRFGSAPLHKKSEDRVILLRFFPPESEEWNAVHLLLENQQGQRHKLSATNTNPPGVSWYTEADEATPATKTSHDKSKATVEVDFWASLLSVIHSEGLEVTNAGTT